ncbi:MAG: UDP-3-O-(3-hydroxymyristoyl)glucosamine N-acyltransferase [Gemmatimonas sp.]|nr:UDP-3-O-(3-hydroxymyristoyl)glucosamine N-acyltransferase [Gemmatimonas sp.]
MREITSGEVRLLVGGSLKGEEDRVVHQVAPIDRAGPEALSFVASPRYLAYLQATRAGVVLVKAEWLDTVPSATTAIVVEDPHTALQVLLSEVYPEAPSRKPGVHPTAIIEPAASISSEAAVGPYAVIGSDTVIGSSEIGAHAVIGAGCRIGDEVMIHSHATLYDDVVVGDRAIIHSGARVGRPGFGYVWRDGGHRKVPQVGGCVIEADVEIGANVTIDRGSVGDTVVGTGTKIDNLVQLGHNVQIGRHVLLVSQVGIAGSSTVGDGAVLAGQVGVGGHLSIGAKATVGAQGGVISDVPEGATYSGYPARPHREAMKAQAGLFKLPEILRRLRRLEAALFRDPGEM